MRIVSLLSLPALIGIVSWLLSWVPYFTLLRYTVYAAQVHRATEIIFVLMVWLGPFTSIPALIVTHRSALVASKKIIFYVLNGIWIIGSFMCLAVIWAGYTKGPH